jgi:hypothetical protein
MKYFFIISFLIVTSEYKSFSQNNIIDPFSRSSCLIVGYRNSKPLLNATGFFLKIGYKTYLITNNHVVGGEFAQNEYKKNHPGKSAPIDSLPDRLSVRVYGTNLNAPFFITIPLKNKDTTYIKFWANETKKAGLMDIVAVPITDANVIQLNGTKVLLETDINYDLILNPATDLYIVGFPGDYASNNIYPLWKRGTVASEPNLMSLNIFDFYVDATTRKGMSGSPVFLGAGLSIAAPVLIL